MLQLLPPFLPPSLSSVPPLSAPSQDATGLSDMGADAPGSSQILGTDPSNVLLLTPGSVAGGFAGDPPAVNTRRHLQLHQRLAVLEKAQAGVQASRDRWKARAEVFEAEIQQLIEEGKSEASKASSSKADSDALVSRLQTEVDVLTSNQMSACHRIAKVSREACSLRFYINPPLSVRA